MDIPEFGKLVENKVLDRDKGSGVCVKIQFYYADGSGK